jgi:hypothetical protein
VDDHPEPATSYVHVDSDEIAVLNKIYGTTSLPGEHIIATNGEKGPQAEILTPGWHPWFLRIPRIKCAGRNAV